MFTTILRWFGFKGTRKKRVAVFPEGYTLEDWRANRELPGQAKKIFDEPVMRHVFSVLYNQIPSGFPLRGEQVNDVQAAVELGRMNGYIECLSLLKSLANPAEHAEEVEQTYGAERVDVWS